MELDEYSLINQVEDKHWWYKGLHELTLHYLNSHVSSENPHPPIKILDAGCGTGGLLSHLDSKWKIYGIDINPKAIEFAKKKTPGQFIQGNLHQIPFEDNFFDFIVSNDVIYHQEINEEQTVREIYRVLKPGGIFFGQVPAFKFLMSPHDKQVHTRKRYRKKEFEKLFPNSNFQIEKISYRIFILFPMVLIIRKIKTLMSNFKKNDKVSDIQMPSKFVNYLLLSILRTENFLLEYMSFPMGTSVFLVAKKLNFQR